MQNANGCFLDHILHLRKGDIIPDQKKKKKGKAFSSHALSEVSARLNSLCIKRISSMV